MTAPNNDCDDDTPTDPGVGRAPTTTGPDDGCDDDIRRCWSRMGGGVKRISEGPDVGHGRCECGAPVVEDADGWRLCVRSGLDTVVCPDSAGYREDRGVDPADVRTEVAQARRLYRAEVLRLNRPDDNP